MDSVTMKVGKLSRPGSLIKPHSLDSICPFLQSRGAQASPPLRPQQQLPQIQITLHPPVNFFTTSRLCIPAIATELNRIMLPASRYAGAWHAEKPCV